MPITTAADNSLKLFILFIFCFFFVLFFKENKSTFHVVCLANDSHEISRLIFSESIFKRKLKDLERCLLQVLLGALRVNYITCKTNKIQSLTLTPDQTSISDKYAFGLVNFKGK